MSLTLPQRYEPISRLGKGGGGEVWAVRDRHSGGTYALKVLSADASGREMLALVREATALSGLEGLGVPRVIRFGRLPESGRPYMVRELVEGRSLLEVAEGGMDVDRALVALGHASEQLTLLHRAGLLHGDIKPANIIVTPEGGATLVDLGLAAPWRETGAPAEGLTPRYAAPELFEGKPLTVRAEVYALGVTLREIAEQPTVPGKQRAALSAVAARATAEDPDKRHPSADEFASELRRAAGLPAQELEVGGAALWPIVGIDGTAARLLEKVEALPPGSSLVIAGSKNSGRSALLRRVAWSLGVAGVGLLWIDDSIVGSSSAVEAEMSEHSSASGLTVLIDDAPELDSALQQRVQQLRDSGARLVLVGNCSLADGARSFQVPPIDPSAATELLRRSIPSLTEGVLKRIVEVSSGRPGELRRIVQRLDVEAVASEADVERLLDDAPAQSSSNLPEGALPRALHYLDRGRFNDARSQLEQLTGRDDLRSVVARARLELGMGEAAAALERLESAGGLAKACDDPAAVAEWRLFSARALIGVGKNSEALATLEPLGAQPGVLQAEALAYQGLALSYAGRHDGSRESISKAVELSRREENVRVEAIALASLGLALQRADRLEEARGAYQRAILTAERQGDAGLLASLRLNVAGLLKVEGDIAGAIEHFEAAVDMGKRSGRRSSVRQALLNLANTDLYLGRLSRARASIETLEQQRAQLPPVMRAQLAGLEAELAARSGNVALAASNYETCAGAYDALGREVDAAEARLEAVLVAARAPHPDLPELRATLERALENFEGTPTHRSLALLARARVAWLAGDEAEASRLLDEALEAAKKTGQREFVWRALEARAELEEAGGQPLRARRDREEALSVLEAIGARLPRDLREVYWNDPRRRQLRSTVQVAMSVDTTDHLLAAATLPGVGYATASSGTSVISNIGATPLEARLARILAVNAELAGEHDLDRLTARITDHAVALLRAERGMVLLMQPDGSLSVHASRAQGAYEAHAEFSRSIAEQVIATGEPVVSLSARDDARMKGFSSVHQLMLQSVACVPITSPGAEPIGALYVETRRKPGRHFETELGTLQAFADQVAIAIENARLLSENTRRANELAEANKELEEAQARLRELLGDRTEKLKQARKKLKSARDTLYGHFGYQGLVGTSGAMRRVYAMIERIKDTDVPVLITGESGTGKEMVARAVHNASLRSKGRFLGINCGAIPEHLLESELFGNVRGAFTGADRDRKGLFRDADGGSVLLDEIGEMPHKMQSGMLRVIQERRVRPVGGSQEEPVDVRMVFATHRDLGQMVAAGTFREDLYYRIHVVEIHMPSLRERVEDIPQLVDHFLGLFAARYKRERGHLTRDAMRRLTAFDWPGNVRQLENVLLNAWVLSEAAELDADDFDMPDGRTSAPQSSNHGISSHPASRHSAHTQPSATSSHHKRARATVSQHQRDERDRIIKALQACNWNRVKAAELSGIPRRTFYRRLREYGIQ